MLQSFAHKKHRGWVFLTGTAAAMHSQGAADANPVRITLNQTRSNHFTDRGFSIRPVNPRLPIQPAVTPGSSPSIPPVRSDRIKPNQTTFSTEHGRIAQKLPLPNL